MTQKEWFQLKPGDYVSLGFQVYRILGPSNMPDYNSPLKMVDVVSGVTSWDHADNAFNFYKISLFQVLLNITAQNTDLDQ